MKKTGSHIYRKIYEQHFGPIPKDEHGRTYEIHHIDGNRNNNDVSNIVALPIKEHYDIHYSQGDYGACIMIAKRMNLPPDHISNIQKGIKRPGVGGRKKGTPNKYKGVKRGPPNMTPDGLLRQSLARKRNNKISDDDAKNIREMYENQIPIDCPFIGKTMRNGKQYSYMQAFCTLYAKKYEVTSSYIRRILTRKSKVV